MNVLVDTSVWSLAFRRGAVRFSDLQEKVRQELAGLIAEGRAVMIGPVRQELLSGVPSESRFKELQEKIASFPNVALEIEDYEEAARISNVCRSHGISGSPIDCLICAVALRRNWSIFTTDDDFKRYQRHISFSTHTLKS